MDSLNEAARHIGKAVEQLKETMVAKGHEKASARLTIGGPEEFTVWLHTGGANAFPGWDGKARDYEFCTARTVGAVYAKADALIDKMEDLHANDAWFDCAQLVEVAAAKGA